MSNWSKIDEQCTKFIGSCKSYVQNNIPYCSFLNCNEGNEFEIRVAATVTACTVFLTMPVSSIAVLATSFFLAFTAFPGTLHEKTLVAGILGAVKLVCSLLNPIALVSLTAVGVAGAILCGPTPERAAS